MPTLRQLTRNSNDTITFVLEDQVWNPDTGGMDRQPLSEITLAEDTWRAILTALPRILDDPRQMTFNF